MPINFQTNSHNFADSIRGSTNIKKAIIPADIRCLVGVLSTVPLGTKSGLPVGKEARLFEEMFALARSQGILMFLFYAPDIDWFNGEIYGYTCTKINKKTDYRWITRVFPIPDIVYNRIRYRSIEAEPLVYKALLKFANHPNIHLFNSRFLNKWEVYQALSTDKITSQFLPLTKPYNRKFLDLFLNNYTEVFLKPRNKSVGKGIIKIIRQTNGMFQYWVVDKEHKIHKKSTPSQHLYTALQKYIEVPQEYLIQQGIDLARLNGSVFDLRTQVQKNGNGVWVPTGIGVRVASKNHFLTHLTNGGRIASYHEVVAQVFGNGNGIKTMLKPQIKNIFKHVPECLERSLNLSLAVLSIDIGIDRTGRMWIIEVNSKPAGFDEDDIRHRHLQYLIDYCIFLTKTNKKDNI